ncbi:hypothetical protein SAMN02910356_00890 [Selenomonas sp. GACV-9]|uniref:hypothetical protein n=1 Tax=Selenomonas sp. GACV-9 TaxID=3158782 RepID=UPI0008EECAC6|nr:hypothetical protein SAMN02910356_00890 [Selenomonas ruminantium]
MYIPWKRLFICRWVESEDDRDEEGAVTVVMLCLLMVVVMFALAMMHTVHTMQKANADYQQEMQLRLAAEGVTEQAAQQLMAQPGMAASWQDEDSQPLAGNRFIYPETMAVQVTALPRKDKLYLIGFARYKDRGAKWERHRMVKGVLKKEGDAYVWLGWAP